MEEETSLEINQNDVADGNAHELGDDIDSYMNDTSHIDDLAGLISPPVEESQINAGPVDEILPSDDIPANDDDKKDAAAKKIQDIANKKKEREDAKKVVNDLRVKKADEVKKTGAANKIQDIAAKKLERLEAQKVTNELRNQRDTKAITESKQEPEVSIESAIEAAVEAANASVAVSAGEPTDTPITSKPSSSRFVDGKRQAVEDNKLGATSASEKIDHFKLDDDDEDPHKDFKPADLKIKIQDSFKNPPERLKKRTPSGSEISPIGSATSKASSSRSVNSESSGGGSSRNLDGKGGKLRFEKMIRRGSIKNHSTLMAPDVDHDEHDGEFSFDLKSEFGVSESHLQVANAISPIGGGAGASSSSTAYTALSPKPPEQPQDGESVPSVRKKSIKVIDPAASSSGGDNATMSPKSEKLSQKIKRKPRSPSNNAEESAGAVESVPSPKRNKSFGEGLGLKDPSSGVTEGDEVTGSSTTAAVTSAGGSSLSSKMKPIRRKSRRAADSSNADEAQDAAAGAAGGTESSSGKENKPIAAEDLAAVEGESGVSSTGAAAAAAKPPKMKISKSARVRSVGSTPNVASDMTPLLDGAGGGGGSEMGANTSSKGRLMSVDDIASPSGSMVVKDSAASAGIAIVNKKPHKPKIKLPELVPQEKRTGAASHAIESSSDRKRRSVVEPDEYDEVTGAIKKKKPLYLRIIARANRQKQEEERLRTEAYNQFRQSRPKNTPSRAEIKEHMAKFDELMKVKQDAARETLAAKVKPFKRAANAPNSRFLPPLFSPSKAQIDPAEGGLAAAEGNSGIERFDSEDPETGGAAVAVSSEKKGKYHSPISNKMKQRLQVEEELDLMANDERRERLKKQRDLSDRVKEELHHKIQHKTPEKLFGGEEAGHSPSKKNIHRSPSKAEHGNNHGAGEAEPHLPDAENDESLLVSKLSPRSRSKHHKALASEHNRMHSEPHASSSSSSSHPSNAHPGRSRKQNSSNALKDMDGNLVFPNGASEVGSVSSYSQDYFTASEVPAELDPAVLITYCASDWIDRLKDGDSTVMVDDELSRMLSDL